jgi:hypothetical protein
MGKKSELISNALHECGIVITEGIPEHIIHYLHKHGYKIKKNKLYGHPSTLIPKRKEIE